MSDGGSINVQSDAQIGMFKVLKPFPNFESIYQDQDGTIPIAFPGNLDPASASGQSGYASNLLAGFKVPMGSRILVMIPQTLVSTEGGGDVLTQAYSYQFIWRVRNQSDVVAAVAAQRVVSAYHLPSEQPGRVEQAGVSDSKLIFLPGSSDIEVFEQTEPVAGAAVLNIRQQRYIPQITQGWVQPLTAQGLNAKWQQGVYQFTSAEQPNGPTWCPLWMDATGDELCILAYKIDSETAWDFTESAADLAFSNTYGTNNGHLVPDPHIGILIATGTMGQ